MAEPENGERWLAEQLKAEASRHEPNLDRIRTRIREHGIAEPVRRSAWLIPAAAATFVVLTAGAITAVHNGRSSDSPGVQVVGPAGTTTPLPARTPPRTTGPVSSAPGVLPRTSHATPSKAANKPTGPAGSGKPKPTGSSDSPTTASRAPRRDVGLTLVAAEPGQQVSLPGNTVDWIATGSDSGNQTIRNADGDQLISGPHDTGNPTSTTTSSPFTVSWTGGMPQQNHPGSTTWRTVTGPVDGPETGLILRVPAGKRQATLVLYVGADGANGQLQTQLGADKVRITRLKAVNGGGYVVRIRFHTEGPDDELTVKLLGGSGGSISLAAATLR
jgi:hypothetical protein